MRQAVITIFTFTLLVASFAIAAPHETIHPTITKRALDWGEEPSRTSYNPPRVTGISDAQASEMRTHIETMIDLQERLRQIEGELTPNKRIWPFGKKPEEEQLRDELEQGRTRFLSLQEQSINMSEQMAATLAAMGLVNPNRVTIYLHGWNPYLSQEKAHNIAENAWWRDTRWRSYRRTGED